MQGRRGPRIPELGVGLALRDVRERQHNTAVESIDPIRPNRRKPQTHRSPQASTVNRIVQLTERPSQDNIVFPGVIVEQGDQLAATAEKARRQVITMGQGYDSNVQNNPFAPMSVTQQQHLQSDEDIAQIASTYAFPGVEIQCRRRSNSFSYAERSQFQEKLEERTNMIEVFPGCSVNSEENKFEAKELDPIPRVRHNLAQNKRNDIDSSAPELVSSLFGFANERKSSLKLTGPVPTDEQQLNTAREEIFPGIFVETEEVIEEMLEAVQDEVFPGVKIVDQVAEVLTLVDQAPEDDQMAVLDMPTVRKTDEETLEDLINDCETFHNTNLPTAATLTYNASMTAEDDVLEDLINECEQIASPRQLTRYDHINNTKPNEIRPRFMG